MAKTFPREEYFGLSDQLRRAAISISNNIAEGSGSASVKGFSSFLNISIRSTLETVNILIFAHKRKYISEQTLNELYKEAEILIKRTRSFKNSL
ncbi:MAG: four helix bundle protein [Candidatus Staskawiczbacteria bacterium]|nr:four helix bundle protein [Candidatus Staskawiczbacteria bacterium]